MAEITVLPPATDQRWRDIATGKIVKPWNMLALKIMMTRIANSTKADPSPANVDKCAQEIRAFFEKNMKLAQQDLAAVFS
jgi:hypothetical protein